MNFFNQQWLPFVLFPLTGLLLSAVLTRCAIPILKKINMIDVPHGRHEHENPVPRGGGVAIVLSFFLPLIFACFIQWEALPLSVLENIGDFLRKFALPALIIFIVGLLDDKYDLWSWLKLIFQVIAALIFYFEGCGIELLFGYELHWALSLIFTVGWCIVIINAFNLIDGLDGLASGLGAISAFLLAMWSLISGENGAMMLILFCFCMSCLGFLRYNFSPAKIFMGDTGSTFIGLFFAYVGMHFSTKAVTFSALLIPLAAVGVPAYDVCLAVLRRLLNKKGSVMTGDADHLHHRLLNVIGDTGKTALIIYGFSILISMAAMTNVFLRSSFPTLIFGMLLIIIFAMIHCANIEIYYILKRVSNVPRKNFLFAVIHPVLDALLILLSLFLFSWFFGKTLPFAWGHWWYLLFLLPLVAVLCFSGIYRTFWLRAGILQFYKLICTLILAGILGYILNGIIWHFEMDLSKDALISASGFYLMSWFLASGLILLERLLLYYYENFGYHRLYIRNQGKKSEIPKVLIYGSGLPCQMYISSIYCRFSQTEEKVKIIGIIDDNPAIKNLNIYGFKVYGGLLELEKIYEKFKFNRIIITGKDPQLLEHLKSFCEEHKIELKKFICEENEV